MYFIRNGNLAEVIKCEKTAGDVEETSKSSKEAVRGGKMLNW